MKRIFAIAIVAAIILSIFTLPAMAEVKAERGAKNLALGWTDIPNTITKVTKDTGNPLIGLTVGTVKGIMNAFARTMSGAVDIVTLPAGEKAPVMKTTILSTETAAADKAMPKSNVKTRDIK